MTAKDKKIEIRVGVFVLIGLVLTMAAILVLGGKQSVFSSTNHYYSHFPKVDGLVPGAKVVIGGLQIGSVHGVDIDSATRDIKVEFTIERKYAKWIRKDSSVEMVTQGVLGDKYLSIATGDAAQPEIEPNGEIPLGVSKDISELFT